MEEKRKKKKRENHKQARFLFLSLLEKMNAQLVLWVSVRGGGRGKGGGRHSSQNDCGFRLLVGPYFNFYTV